MFTTCAAALFVVFKISRIVGPLQLRNAHCLTYRSYTARHAIPIDCYADFILRFS